MRGGYAQPEGHWSRPAKGGRPEAYRDGRAGSIAAQRLAGLGRGVVAFAGDREFGRRQPGQARHAVGEQAQADAGRAGRLGPGLRPAAPAAPDPPEHESAHHEHGQHGQGRT